MEILEEVQVVIFERTCSAKKSPKPWKLFRDAGEFFRENQNLVPIQAHYDNDFQGFKFRESLSVTYDK